MSPITQNNAPDLRTGYPRSPNATLGGYVLLPRIIDKCRAVLAGTNGEYNYNCPLDRQFFDWANVDADAFKAEIAAGQSDEELLAWISQHASQTDPDAIRAWGYQMRWRRPTEPQMMAYFEQLRESIAPDNYQIETWFQLLDADEKRF